MSETAVYVAKATSYLFIQNIGTAVSQIIAFSIIARLITPYDMGVVAALTLTIIFVSTIVDLGLPSAATKFIAEHLGKNDLQTAKSAFFQIFRVSLILSSVAAVACLFFSEIISLLLLKTSEMNVLFIVLALDVIPSGLFASLYSSLMGFRKIREAALFNLLRQFAKQAIFVSLLFSGFGLLGLPVAWLIADTINILLYIGVAFKPLGSPTFGFSLKRLLKFSYPLYFGNIVNFAYGWFDRILLLAFLPLSILGIYDVALRAFAVLNSITIAMSTVLLAKYSELYGKMGIEAVEQAIPAASRYICLIAMPLAFGLAAVANPALTLFAGASYSIGSSPLTILSIFFGLACIGASFSTILMILEETLLVSLLSIIAVVAGTILTIVLLPSFGIVGASLARGVSLVLHMLLLVWILKRKVKLAIDREALWKSLLASIIMVQALVVVQFLYYDVSFLPIYLLVGSVVYLGMLGILKAAKEEDIKLLKSLVGRRFEFLVKPIEIILVRNRITD